MASNQSFPLWFVQAWLIFLLPLHFFFHFLFYTDVGSVTFVVAAYLVSLASASLPQSLAGQLRIYCHLSCHDSRCRVHLELQMCSACPMANGHHVRRHIVIKCFILLVEGGKAFCQGCLLYTVCLLSKCAWLHHRFDSCLCTLPCPDLNCPQRHCSCIDLTADSDYSCHAGLQPLTLRTQSLERVVSAPMFIVPS